MLRDIRIDTLPKTNIAPGNRPSQKEIHLPTIIFQGLLVSGRIPQNKVFEPVRLFLRQYLFFFGSLVSPPKRPILALWQ